MPDWRFGRRDQACGACERGFAAGDTVFSSLLIADGELRRLDRCGDCFRGAGEVDEGIERLAWWRTRFDPDRKRGLVVDFDAVDALFGGLAGRTEERLVELRFLLCLMLIRKRRLKLVKVRRDAEGEWMILKRPRKPDELDCRAVDLGAEALAARRADLAGILEGADLEAVLAGPATVPADAGPEPAVDAEEA